jgi:hypothetical protein
VCPKELAKWGRKHKMQTLDDVEEALM